VSDCRRGLFEEQTAIAMLKVFRMRYNAFRERFGRDPEPDEPLFFDPAQEQPVVAEPPVIRSQVMAAALAARVDPHPVLDLMCMSHQLGPATPLPTWPDVTPPSPNASAYNRGISWYDLCAERDKQLAEIEAAKPPKRQPTPRKSTGCPRQCRCACHKMPAETDR